MAKNFLNVMDYKVVANNGFQFNVKVNGVNNFGNRKWMLKAVEVIRDYFTFADGADEGLIVNVIVNTHEIIVKAEFNGKKYFTFPIQPKYGKNQIKDILDNMDVVKDVIDVYTNNLVKDIYVDDEYDEDEYDDNEWSDRDWLIKRTADTIKDYLGNYMPSYLDQFGDCVITVYWDEFSEDMMKNMIEDDDFALQVKSLVYGVDGIMDFLVYDDGVYVNVDYDKMFNKVA